MLSYTGVRDGGPFSFLSLPTTFSACLWAKLGFVIFSAEGWRVEIKGESPNCIAIKAALVKDGGEEDRMTEKKSRDFPYCSFLYPWSWVFIMNHTPHFISLRLYAQKLSFQKWGSFVPLQA